jgi:hypothetical protein
MKLAAPPKPTNLKLLHHASNPRFWICLIGFFGGYIHISLAHTPSPPEITLNVGFFFWRSSQASFSRPQKNNPQGVKISHTVTIIDPKYQLYRPSTRKLGTLTESDTFNFLGQDGGTTSAGRIV